MATAVEERLSTGLSFPAEVVTHLESIDAVSTGGIVFGIDDEVQARCDCAARDFLRQVTPVRIDSMEVNVTAIPATSSAVCAVRRGLGHERLSRRP